MPQCLGGPQAINPNCKNSIVNFNVSPKSQNLELKQLQSPSPEPYLNLAA